MLILLLAIKNKHNNQFVFFFSQDRANFATKVEALHDRVEADTKFLEELEQQSSTQGLRESTLLKMLQELREMLRQFEVGEKHTFRQVGFERKSTG